MSNVPIRFVEDPSVYTARSGDAKWLSSGGECVTITATGEPAPLREHAAIAYRCPGCGQYGSIPVSPRKANDSWEWDGNVDAPTLKPSILKVSCCGWHGHLTAGVFVPC